KENVLFPSYPSKTKILCLFFGRKPAVSELIPVPFLHHLKRHLERAIGNSKPFRGETVAPVPS
ncbi:MAG: hypothetical protein QF832_20255, partial [SAR324 cluster bacterium]|nr:hypothetical protein [SAR324 cluster bacterium]